ncbi:MAG: Rieske (2Fe-2S) protein [Nitrospinae bacterium]|nr:Rieske (2Fe-2S) protein [Nitrospinota bacterium]
MKYVRVVKLEDLPIGKSIIVSAKDEEIALFNYKGKYHAIANKCLHKGSPLGEGRIEEGVVICPNHEWRYDLNTGECMQNPYMKTKIYPVKVHKGAIYIGLEIEDGNKPLGKTPSALPSALKFSVPVIQKPRNPDEEL